MGIAHYCPSPVWPLSRPGFTVITPKLQKLAHCSEFKHTILCTQVLHFFQRQGFTVITPKVQKLSDETFHFEIQKRGPSCPNWGRKGGELIWAMPESKHSFYRPVCLLHNFECAKTPLSNLMPIRHEQSV